MERTKVGNNTTVWHPEKSVILDCEIGQDCRIHAPVWIGDGVKIGNNVKIQAFAFIPSGVTIEDDVFIAPCVCFTNDKYPPSDGEGWQKTLVKKGAVIGANATIIPGITIGEGAMIGAGSVVLTDVPDRAVFVGNPARKIRYRDPMNGYESSSFETANHAGDYYESNPYKKGGEI